MQLRYLVFTVNRNPRGWRASDDEVGHSLADGPTKLPLAKRGQLSGRAATTSPQRRNSSMGNFTKMYTPLVIVKECRSDVAAKAKDCSQ